MSVHWETVNIRVIIKVCSSSWILEAPPPLFPRVLIHSRGETKTLYWVKTTSLHVHAVPPNQKATLMGHCENYGLKDM